MNVDASGEPFRFVVLGAQTGGELVPGQITAAGNRRHARILRYLRSGSWVIRDPLTRGRDALDPGAEPAVPRGYRTDGIWIWPLALEYYYERHGVAPPADLLDLMARSGHYPRRIRADRCGQAHQALLARAPGPFEPAAPMQFRLPPDVFDFLLTVGWVPGREIAVDPALDPQRRAVLAEFGDLAFPAYGYARDWRVTGFLTRPKGEPSDPALIAAAQRRLGGPLLPIGSVPQWAAEIVLHPEAGIGTVCADPEHERFLGRDIDEALTSLIRGAAVDPALRAAAGWVR
ncbi:SUKH-3 domain-containing protein [Dactylosporangium vinaceum]|uniref:SUKH-3 domain-containing protein n=1 Tax=Dactylosporangium vinaceum TaxID=53362 RepID=A0ABV5M621_9ACTN|nr:SUKH-3 domain-containing protein [Dactylosporangium vinaceum]UAB97732.1 SUKH-3 domain-containing protein [Dactylosporangium vinaceum]